MRLRFRSLSLLMSLLACGCGGAPPSVAEPVVVTLPAATSAAAATPSPAATSAVATEEPGPVEMVQVGPPDATREPRMDGTPTASDRPVAPARPAGPPRIISGRGSGISALSDGPPPPRELWSGHAVKVKGPVGEATIGAITVEGSVANASPVAASMAAGFRRCFNKGLQENLKMKGSIVINAAIGVDGQVLSAKPTAQSGLSDSVVACVAARVVAAQFAPPDGGSAKLMIPVQFDSF